LDEVDKLAPKPVVDISRNPAVLPYLKVRTPFAVSRCGQSSFA